MKHLSLNAVQFSNRFGFIKLEVALKSKLFILKQETWVQRGRVTCPGALLVGTDRTRTQPLGVGPLPITQSASGSNADGLMFIVDKWCTRIDYIHVLSHGVSHLPLTSHRRSGECRLTAGELVSCPRSTVNHLCDHRQAGHPL